MSGQILASVGPLAHAPIQAASGLLFVLSGPSGVGKDEAIKELKKRPTFAVHHAITATTRAPRAGERDGVHYYFVSRDEFTRMQQNGELLEWALFRNGHCYGTPLQQVKEHLRGGEDVLLKIDVQGAATVKQQVPGAIFIFLAPPSMTILEQRLTDRKTESPQELRARLETARDEMSALDSYDYCVVNHHGRLDEAVQQIAAIVTAERCRVKQRSINLDAF